MKKLPKFKSDKELESFIDDNDLADYITKDNLKLTSFELKPKDTTITLRLSSDLLTSIKKRAKRKKINYQKYIRVVLSQNVA